MWVAHEIKIQLSFLKTLNGTYVQYKLKIAGKLAHDKPRKFTQNVT